LLCEPENVEALATALEKMIMDEAYRKKVQKNALERSNFYDMEHTMNRWEAYLKTVVNAD
jgi:glycosyltransferase involved in cell wall biosynthesis